MLRRTTASRGDDEDAVDALTGKLSQVTLPPKYAACFRRTDGSEVLHPGPTRAERCFADSKKAGTEDGLLFDPADYPEEEERDRMLEKFFDTSLPSNVYRSDGIGWIRVRSPNFKDGELGNLEDLEDEWDALQRSKRHVDFDAIKSLALSNSCLGGIWLLFFETGASVDIAWEKIARVTVEGKLGTHAKVTPVEDEAEAKDLHGTSHCISVYTKDFTDKDDVLAVEAALRSLGFKARLSYKPRVYSSLGIFSRNKWNLRPSIYISEWDDAKQAGKIQDYTKPRNKYVGRHPHRKR